MADRQLVKACAIWQRCAAETDTGLQSYLAANADMSDAQKGDV